MYPIYMKWQYDAPTVTSIESTNYPIWNIYFPAITVCSNNKILSGRFRSILKRPPWSNISAAYNESGSDTGDVFKENLYQAVKTMILFQAKKNN